MSDPYADAFARDYIGSTDFAHMYGVGRPIRLRFFQFGTKETRDPSNYSGGKIPKPVVWFVEHQDAPMFVNRGQHEYMLNRFGNEYWLQERRNAILHAPIDLTCTVKERARDRLYVINWSGLHYDQWTPMGEKWEQKLKAAGQDLATSRDDFRKFVRSYFPELLDTLDHTGKFSDMPILFKPVYEDYLRECRGNLDRAEQPEQAKPKESDPAPEPNFEPTKGKGSTEITADDIPF